MYFKILYACPPFYHVHVKEQLIHKIYSVIKCIQMHDEENKTIFHVLYHIPNCKMNKSEIISHVLDTTYKIYWFNKTSHLYKHWFSIIWEQLSVLSIVKAFLSFVHVCVLTQSSNWNISLLFAFLMRNRIERFAVPLTNIFIQRFLEFLPPY